MIRRLFLIAFLAAFVVTAAFAADKNRSATPRRSFDQLLQAGEKARDENRDDEAIRLFRQALSEQPESEQALWYLGSLLHEKEQYAEARDVLRQFVTNRPDAGPGWALLGLGEFQLREYPRALGHLQRAFTVGIGDRKELIHEVLYNTAILLTRAEQYDDSVDLMVKMLANDPHDPALVQPLGLAGLQLPLLPSEIPQDRREFVNLVGHAVLALESQLHEQADSSFQKLVAAYPHEPGVHFLFGVYLMQLHPELAIPEFEQELRISPSHVLARVRIAEQLIANGDFDRALSTAREAIRLDPKRASAHMLAGEALIAKGQSSEGIGELEAARTAAPGLIRAHLDLLRAYAADGRKDDAEREKQQIDRLLHSNSSPHLGEPGDASHN